MVKDSIQTENKQLKTDTPGDTQPKVQEKVKKSLPKKTDDTVSAHQSTSDSPALKKEIKKKTSDIPVQDKKEKQNGDSSSSTSLGDSNTTSAPSAELSTAPAKKDPSLSRTANAADTDKPAVADSKPAKPKKPQETPVPSVPLHPPDPGKASGLDKDPSGADSTQAAPAADTYAAKPAKAKAKKSAAMTSEAESSPAAGAAAAAPPAKHLPPTPMDGQVAAQCKATSAAAPAVDGERPASSKKKDKAADATAAAAATTTTTGDAKPPDKKLEAEAAAVAAAEVGGDKPAKKKGGKAKAVVEGEAAAAGAAASAAASSALTSLRKGLDSVSRSAAAAAAAAAARVERLPIFIDDRRGKNTVEQELKALKEAVQAVEGERDSIVAVIRKLEAAVQEHEQTAERLMKEIKSIKRWSFGGVNKACMPLETKLSVARGEKEVMTAELEEFCQVVYKLEAELESMRMTSAKLEHELKLCR